MSSHPCIGIDLGTATSEIAVYQDGVPLVLPDPDSPGRSPVVPSLVAVDGRGRLLVGEAARAYADVPGRGLRQVKRRMGTSQRVIRDGTEYRPEEVSVQILRHLKQTAEQALGQEVREAVISVPANFPEPARKATFDAAELAGLKVRRLINEPTAAALAFGLKRSKTEGRVVVFDFGGGTLDVTVLEMMEGILDVRASFGDPALGGKDFDEALVGMLRQRFQGGHPRAQVGPRAAEDLRSVAETVKIQLSRHAETVARCANYASEDGSPLDLELDVTRQEFEGLVAPLLDRARVCLVQALEKARLQPAEVEHVLLVGGTTYIPSVRQLVASVFGREPRRDVDPDLAVAQGAAIEAALIAGAIPAEVAPIKTDVSPFGLGVDIMGVVGRHLVPDLYDPLILPNTTIPFSTQKDYSLLHDEQKRVRLSLYQDHKGGARTVHEAQKTGLSAEIDDIPPALNGTPHPLQVSFSYDLNGLINLELRIPATGQVARLMTHRDGARNLNPEAMAEALQKVEELWSRSPLAKRLEPLLRRAEKRIPDLRPEDRKRVHEACTGLKTALESGDEAAAEKAADRLTDLLFDLEG